MKRGDVVVVSLAGELGKPRPAVIVQSDHLNAQAPSTFLVCPLTTELTNQHDVRVAIDPGPGNGLVQRSEVMVEKLTPAPIRRVGKVIGRLDTAIMRDLDRAMVLVLGIT